MVGQWMSYISLVLVYLRKRIQSDECQVIYFISISDSFVFFVLYTFCFFSRFPSVFFSFACCAQVDFLCTLETSFEKQDLTTENYI